MPTLFTDPRSGGVKKSSGVDVLPIVSETWAEVRNDSHPSTDWLLAGYHGTSKTQITILTKGHGGLEACANVLPPSEPVFGGVKLRCGKFVHFFYADEDTSVMKKGRASMHKNGVLNVLEGCVDEIQIKPGMTEDDLANISSTGTGTGTGSSSTETTTSINNVMSTEKTTMCGNKTNATYNEAVTTNTYKTTTTNTTNEFNQQEHDLNQKMKSIDINTLENQQQDTSSSQHKTDNNKNDDQYEKMNEPKSKTMEKETDDNESSQQPSSSFSSNTYIPYSELKGISDTTQLPPTVDPLHREASLSDQEFYEIFGMDKDSFYKLPTWKQVNKKKEKLLF